MAALGSSAPGMPILLLGPSAVGKTLLVRQLEHLAKSGELCPEIETSPTTGAELDDITCGDGQVVSVREVGAPMMPMWPSYFKGSHAVMYMVDLSQMLAVSAAVMELFSLLEHPDLKSKPFLLIFNKTDVSRKLPMQTIEIMFRLSDLVKTQRRERQFTVLETSVLKGIGLEEVSNWLAGL